MHSSANQSPTLSEFLAPIKKKSWPNLCLGTLLYFHEVKQSPGLSPQEIKSALSSARIKSCKSLNVSDVLAKAGANTESKKDANKTIWFLTDTGKENAKSICARVKKSVADSTGDIEVQGLLKKVSPELKNGYDQVLLDLADTNRLSWRGTANELREILRELLHTLAPDEQVTKAKWFKQNPDTDGPTQAQRTKFILEKYNCEDSVIDSVKNNVSILNELISNLVRSTFQRANGATHGFKDKKELIKILNYFNLLIKDLLKNY